MMACGGGSDQEEVKSECGLAPEKRWSEEHDCVPLKQRLKMLLAKGVSTSQERTSVSDIPAVIVKKEDDDDQRDSVCFQTAQSMPELRSDSDSASGKRQQGTASHIKCSSLQDMRLSKFPKASEVKSRANNPATRLESCQEASSIDDASSVRKNLVTHEDFLDDLDHIVLKERRRMLLSRKLVGSTKPSIKTTSKTIICFAVSLQCNLSNLPTNVDGMILQNVGIGRGVSDLCRNISAAEGDGLSVKGVSAISCQSPALASRCQETMSTGSEKFENVHGEARSPCSSRKAAINKNSSLSSHSDNVPMTDLQPFAMVKIEPLDNESQMPKKDAMIKCCLDNLFSVKSELANDAETCEDVIDHMLLGERMKLIGSGQLTESILYENLEKAIKVVPPALDYRPGLTASLKQPKVKPLKVKRPRKRRKTVTDSIETALEEDAPGLLQVLIEKGVLLDEIKLYGEPEGDEELDESLIEESFSELEAVISKIFSQRQSFLKFAPIRCSTGEKASYCLAALISLVEQARYLQFRKWPVEWGWCRDLQSFIFVFERHNRIVLERPEYGYATYFFELVDTLPVHWQIKRLVIAMKLTSCSRITLIENRALTIGEDLTEGEAKVLMDYGWIPDTGLGTMLNYCDRVVHDRKHEKDTSEWRSKIGKLLMDGYNGGTIVPNDIPKKLMEFGVVHSCQIKLEQ